jgi:hypothetical protein
MQFQVATDSAGTMTPVMFFEGQSSLILTPFSLVMMGYSNIFRENQGTPETAGGDLSIAAGQALGTDQNGGILHLNAGQGTGTGTSGIEFQVAPQGGTGSVPASYETALTIGSYKGMSTGSNWFISINSNSDDANANYLAFYKDRSAGALPNLQTSDNIGEIQFRGNVNGAYVSDLADIKAIYTGNGTTKLGAFKFRTNDDTSLDTRMYITNGVHIGNTHKSLPVNNLAIGTFDYVTTSNNIVVSNSANTRVQGANCLVMGGDNQVGGYGNSIVVGNNNGGVVGQYTFMHGYANSGGVAGFETMFGDYNDVSAAGAHNLLVGTGNAVTGSAQNCFLMGGGLTASRSQSFVAGIYGNATMFGQHVHASGRFTTTGDAQTSELVARLQTTSDTPNEIALDGGTTYLSTEVNKAYAYVVTLVAKRTGSTQHAMYRLKWVTMRDATTTVTIDGLVKETIFESNAAWDVNVTADNTNARPAIMLTGVAAQAINWVAKIEVTEVLS